MSREALLIHDLSYPIRHGMSTYPASYHPAVEVVQLGDLDVVGRESRRLVLGTHSGTHVDAPSHFIPNGATIDQAALDVLIGPARMVRFPDCAAGRSITAQDLRGQLGARRPERVLLRLDWSRHWGTPDFYLRSPYLAPDAVDHLIAIGVRLLGMDIASCDDPRQSGPGRQPDSPNHRALLSHGVVLIEYLTNLSSIEADEFELIALPLAVAGGDGAPARVVAVETVR